MYLESTITNYGKLYYYLDIGYVYIKFKTIFWKIYFSYKIGKIALCFKIAPFNIKG